MIDPQSPVDALFGKRDISSGRTNTLANRVNRLAKIAELLERVDHDGREHPVEEERKQHGERDERHSEEHGHVSERFLRLGYQTQQEEDAFTCREHEQNQYNLCFKID